MSIMRRIPAEDAAAAGDGKSSLGGKLIIMSTHGDAGALAIRREARGAVDSHQLVRSPIPNGVRFAPEPCAQGRGLELSLTTTRLVYTEEETIDVAGDLVCPALQWYLPGKDSALLYLTQTWEVTGTIIGRPVRGFLFWEEAYMLPDARLYVTKDPLHDVGYTTWYSWANRYADGTAEVGHFLFGQHDFHVGVIASSDGTVRSVTRMNAVVDRDADGYWHRGIVYDLDGEAWICEPDQRGRMQLGPIPNPQQEGRIRRRDDDREVEAWMAWGETVPDNGEVRRTTV
jgi:hypothetical protein